MGRPFKGTTFWDRVWPLTLVESNNCISFTGSRDECGYGRINKDGKLIRLHRAVWTEKNGPIPEGLFICHTCDNPSCINLNHLYLGTHSDNMRDKFVRGRQSVAGEKNPAAKLNKNKVREIREKIINGVECYALGREYGVSGETILAIKHNRTWVGV